MSHRVISKEEFISRYLDELAERKRRAALEYTAYISDRMFARHFGGQP